MSSSDTPKESCGFFSGIFGSGSTASVAAEKCISCGNAMDDCACNNSLKEHLKNCCGYGTLPKLIEKCCETPGYKDPATITTSSCAGGCQSAPKEDCGAPKDTCGAPKDTCGAPKDTCGAPKDTCGAPKDACAAEPKEDCAKKGDKCSGGGGKVCCPPMPPTDCCNCKPAWMSCPPSITVKSYAAPENDRILPLSTGGRNGGGCGADTSSKCGGCGTEKPPPGKPKISAGCPMNKANCPGLMSKDDGNSIFAKIIAFFKGK